MALTRVFVHVHERLVALENLYLNRRGAWFLVTITVTVTVTLTFTVCIVGFVPLKVYRAKPRTLRGKKKSAVPSYSY